MRPHYDHLAIEFQRGLHNRRTYRRFTNKSLGIRRQSPQLVHIVLSCLPQQWKRIGARHRTVYDRRTRDVDHVQKDQPRPERAGQILRPI